MGRFGLMIFEIGGCKIYVIFFRLGVEEFVLLMLSVFYRYEITFKSD